MKKYTVYVTVVLMFVILSGAAAAKTIAEKSKSERTDVFTETTSTEAAPAGFSDVVISADIKTHRDGFYSGESKHSAHGKELYPFLFNIDGQAVLWKVEGKKHELPSYDADGKTSKDPEAGEGIKYLLSKKIRLRAGQHTLFFGLPEDDYAREIVIQVKEGQALTLEFKPVYKYKTQPARIPTFMRGVSSYDMLVNGTPAAS